LVERLLDAGLRVLALHPNQVGAARDRFRVSGGKSDRFDAFVLCELARTDHHRFRVLEPDSDQTKALRALTSGREDLVGARTALVNQLRAELERFWPGPLALFSHLHGRISLAFIERYPSPADARGLGEARLAAFLARERYCAKSQVWVASRSGAGDTLLGVWPGLAERPDIRYVVRDWLAKLQIVAAGLAITTLAPITLDVLPDGVKAVAVRGEPQETRRVVLAHCPGPLDGPTARVADALIAAAAA
jgi:hypothetical protein